MRNTTIDFLALLGVALLLILLLEGCSWVRSNRAYENYYYQQVASRVNTVLQRHGYLRENCPINQDPPTVHPATLQQLKQIRGRQVYGFYDKSSNTIFYEAGNFSTLWHEYMHHATAHWNEQCLREYIAEEAEDDAFYERRRYGKKN